MKDLDLFLSKIGICYISEAGREYKYDDYLSIAKGNEYLARILFDLSEWQHPETIFNDLIIEGEIDEEGNIIEQ